MILNLCSPEANIPENSLFNRYLSAVRVRSEHAIGYLKGRFYSLKSVPIAIQSLEHVNYLNAWILAAVCVHNFTLLREDGIGLEDSNPSDLCGQAHHGGQGDERRPEELARGREKREQLKAILIDSISQ